MPGPRRRGAVRWRRAAGLAAGLALILGSTAIASPGAVHVPRYRYYHLARTDTRPHAIHASVLNTSSHYDSLVVGFVTQTLRGRQDVFDFGYVGTHGFADVTAGNVSTPQCEWEAICVLPERSGEALHVGFPVWFDYFFVARDATVTVDLSESPDKHWVFKELTGDPRVTGMAHVLMPEDGDVVNVDALGIGAQRVRDISHPGGRYGSIAMAMAPQTVYGGIGSIGSARLDGGRAYVQGITTLEGGRSYAVGSAGAATTWRLHGDLVTVGHRSFLTLLVYDLPEPKALRAFMRRR